jgi:pSer/pThr/pTyr-binding forkhead associated (FHA) protein/NADPH-dependent 2,4-dienoyl-CoA reductase/sulfur reductase-like enzyme
MTARQSYLIVGNGIAGATAAEILRNEDAAAEITVVADDPFPVYYRPALKDYLAGKIREDNLWARPISFYLDRRVRFLTDRVVGIEPAQHRVQLRGGQTVEYSRLLLAHGANASTLSCPGANLAGVTTLRTVADYQNVLNRLPSARRIVVTGSGTLALESIETLRHRGFQVTHLLRRRALWSEVLDPAASDLVLQQEKRDGVDIRYEQEIAEIVGQNGQVKGITTTTGAHIPCEIVLLGIGIDPITDFVKSAGIECGRGVKVDGSMRTNAPDVYAAGDLIETSDPITKRSRVIGQWYPSIQQARAAAYSMLDLLDRKRQFRFGNFYNASFLYGLDFASVGISNIPKDGKGYEEIVADPQPRTYQKVILHDGIPVGMLALGDRRSVITFKRAIDASVNLSPVASRLFAPDFKLNDWLDAQGVPGPILGVSREGTVAIQKAAYADMANRSVILKAQELTEAMLVPLTSEAPPDLQSILKETYLSQTRVTSIGRQEGSTVAINHSSISRRHAEISYAGGYYLLRDLKSTNGTFVNDQRLDPEGICQLKSGDKVRFGKVAFALQLRHVDPSSSVLLRRPIIAALPVSDPSAANGKAWELETEQADEDEKQLLKNIAKEVANRPGAKASPVSSVGMPAADVQASVGQPTFNADGSLRLPGTTHAVSAGVVASMRSAPALAVLMRAQPEIMLLKQGQRYSLGRDKSSSIMLPDVSVSRKHAEVFPGPDGYYIRDLGSSNGVMVNQTRINNPYRLSNGDRIMVGNVPLFFISPDEHETPSSALKMGTPAAESKSSKICHSCGSENNIVARFCAVCGVPLK